MLNSLFPNTGTWNTTL